MMCRPVVSTRSPMADRPRSDRRGTAIVIAIVALVLVTAICFSLVRITLSAVEQAERQQWGRQSAWLAETAVAQAAAQLRSEGEFSDDTWEVTLPGSQAPVDARIELEITASRDNPQQRIVTATAEFPRHPTDRVRVTRTLTLIVPQSTPEEPEES